MCSSDKAVWWSICYQQPSRRRRQFWRLLSRSHNSGLHERRWCQHWRFSQRAWFLGSVNRSCSKFCEIFSSVTKFEISSEKFWQKFFVSCWSPISTTEWSTNTWLRHLLAPDTMVGGGLGPVVTTSGVCRWWVCAADHVVEECRDWCPGVWGGEEAGLLLSTGVMLTWGQETEQWPATDHPVPQPGSRVTGLTAVSAVVTGHRRGE